MKESGAVASPASFVNDDANDDNGDVIRGMSSGASRQLHQHLNLNETIYSQNLG